MATGQWADLMRGDFTQASDIQIDDFVPLKNAYVSGAYKWNSKKRCLYGKLLREMIFICSQSMVARDKKKSDGTPES